jgi:hypothetical protein
MRAEMASGIGYLEAYNCHVGGVTGLPAQSNIYTRKPVDAAKTNALKRNCQVPMECFLPQANISPVSAGDLLRQR